MKLYLTTLALLFTCTGASATGAPGGLTGSGDSAQSAALTPTEQREQFRCEQTRMQIADVLKHKPLTQADQDSLKSLREIERNNCKPPLVQPPASALTHPAAYPMQSMRAGHQGIVVVLLDVASDGSVAKDSLYRSSGYSELDRSALEAVRKWHFDEQKGTTIRVPVAFKTGR